MTRGATQITRLLDYANHHVAHSEIVGPALRMISQLLQQPASAYSLEEDRDIDVIDAECVKQDVCRVCVRTIFKHGEKGEIAEQALSLLQYFFRAAYQGRYGKLQDESSQSRWNGC